MSSHERTTSDGTAIRSAVRALIGEQRHEEAWRLLRPSLTGAGEDGGWDLARSVVRSGEANGWTPATKRTIRLAVLCSYEGAELAAYLQLACQAFGIDAQLYAAPFGQLEQEVLDERSGLAAFEPTHVLIAPTAFDLDFPQLAENGAELLEREESRWRGLWDASVRSSVPASCSTRSSFPTRRRSAISPCGSRAASRRWFAS